MTRLKHWRVSISVLNGNIGIAFALFDFAKRQKPLVNPSETYHANKIAHTHSIASNQRNFEWTGSILCVDYNELNMSHCFLHLDLVFSLLFTSIHFILFCFPHFVCLCACWFESIVYLVLGIALNRLITNLIASSILLNFLLTHEGD